MSVKDAFLVSIFFMVFVLFINMFEESSVVIADVSVDRIEDGIIVLQTSTGYNIYVDQNLMPTVKEGDIVRIEYTVDVEASAELRNEIVSLQTKLLERN